MSSESRGYPWPPTQYQGQDSGETAGYLLDTWWAPSGKPCVWGLYAHPRRLVLAQSKTLCMAVTPSRPMGATSPPVMMA